MKAQLSHQLTSSVMQWIDNTLLTKGEAFTNYGGKFYEMKDAALAGYSVYALPFGQLVYDRAITGASIPSGVYANNQFCPRGQSGLHIDFQRGRAIFDPNHRGLNISGNVAVKEFDVIYATQPEDELLISSKFSLKPSFNLPFTGLASNEYLFPAIFVTKQRSQNKPFELGEAANNHTTDYRILVMAANDWQLDGIESIFTAQKHRYLPLLGDSPFDFFGDLKDQTYNFNTLKTGVSPESLVYISQASFARFTSKANAVVNPLVYVGVLTLSLEIRVT